LKKKKIIPVTKKAVHFNIATRETYPQILWEMVMDPLGSRKHTLVTTNTDHHPITAKLLSTTVHAQFFTRIKYCYCILLSAKYITCLLLKMQCSLV